MLSFLNLHHIYSVSVLLVTLFLSHPPLLHFLSQVPYPPLIQSYCLHYLLLPCKFTPVAQGHLLQLHHLSQNHCLLLSEKVPITKHPISHLGSSHKKQYWSLMFTNARQIIQYSICLLIEIRGMTHAVLLDWNSFCTMISYQRLGQTWFVRWKCNLGHMAFWCSYGSNKPETFKRQGGNLKIPVDIVD